MVSNYVKTANFPTLNTFCHCVHLQIIISSLFKVSNLTEYQLMTGWMLYIPDIQLGFLTDLHSALLLHISYHSYGYIH